MKKILLDLEICYQCKSCEAQCSYFYHQSDVLKVPLENRGVEKLLSYGAQYIVCRRCEEKFCVRACPNEALEKDERGILQRHSLLCTSCKSCSVACPFGTLYLDLLPYTGSACDHCAGRADETHPPRCTVTCPKGALKYVEAEEDPGKNVYLINENVAVHGLPWNKEALAGVPKKQ